MEEGRIPAQVYTFLDGEKNLCGTNNSDNEANNTAENAAAQPNSAKKIRKRKPGNNCDHKKTNPDFWSRPKHHESRSSVICETIEEIEKSYFSPRHSLAAVQHHEDNKQIRSEQRQVIIDILKFMVYSMDDETQRVGMRLDRGKWKDVSLKSIAEKIKVSLERVETAMKQIKKCGYLFVKRQYVTNKEGRKIGLPSIRQITPKLFIDLGIKYADIFKLKKYKEERRLKKEMKVDKEEAQVVSDFIKKCYETSTKVSKVPSTIEIDKPKIENQPKHLSEVGGFYLNQIKSLFKKPSPA